MPDIDHETGADLDHVFSENFSMTEREAKLHAEIERLRKQAGLSENGGAGRADRGSDKPSRSGDGGSDNLLTVAAAYIEANGGKAVVIGGIEVQQWPEDAAMTYRLAIKFTGHKPSAV